MNTTLNAHLPKKPISTVLPQEALGNLYEVWGTEMSCYRELRFQSARAKPRLARNDGWIKREVKVVSAARWVRSAGYGGRGKALIRLVMAAGRLHSEASWR